MATRPDPLISKLVRELDKKMRRQIGVDFYHRFRDQVSVRDVADFIGVDHAQFYRLYREKYPSTS